MKTDKEILRDLKKDLDPYTYEIIAYFAKQGKAVEKPQRMPQADSANTSETLAAVIAWTATKQMEILHEVEKAGGTELQQTMALVAVLSSMITILQKAMDAL